MRISMRRVDVENKILKSRSDHREEFKQQLLAWQNKMSGPHQGAMERWVGAGGKDNDRPREPIKPKDYSNDYDRLLEQIQLHCLEIIELRDEDYDKVILNKFGWSHQFHGTSTTYGIASTAYSGDY